MNHMQRIAFAALIAVPLALPGSAHAGGHGHGHQWYDSNWFWGSTGLVVGGAVGYALGQEDASYYYPAPTYYSPTTGGGEAAASNGTVYKETRVWPFYRHIESYPVANTAPISVSPQSVSYGEAMMQSRGVDQQSQPVTVNVGDNNSNVTVNLGPDGSTQMRTSDTVYVVENNVPGAGRRVIDMRGKQVVVLPAAPATETQDAKDMKRAQDAALSDNPPPVPAQPTPVVAEEDGKGLMPTGK